MDRAQRKRRAMIGAMALLQWRDRMAKENAEREMVQAKCEEMVRAKYERMIAEMRAQADAPRTASHTTPCKLVAVAVHSNGAAGVTS
jgi:hypothetical protein